MLRNGSAFSYTTAANIATNTPMNVVAARSPATGFAIGTTPPRVIRTGDVKPFSLFEPIFVRFGTSALLVITERAGRLYIRTTYELCPITPVAPTKHRGKTTDVVIISATPRPATHRAGRRVVEKRFVVVTTTARVTPAATTTDLSRILSTERSLIISSAFTQYTGGRGIVNTFVSITALHPIYRDVGMIATGGQLQAPLVEAPTMVPQ